MPTDLELTPSWEHWVVNNLVGWSTTCYIARNNADAGDTWPSGTGRADPRYGIGSVSEINNL